MPDELHQWVKILDGLQRQRPTQVGRLRFFRNPGRRLVATKDDAAN